ncbi:MAG: SirA-like protein [Candidatus Margulisiibacteriota bacterium]|nr:MAG: SirA-like protein [Candidatus Margulisbacteria bacterium GWD2_39_127]OGI02770.1 MAG: SirA-like protein [Candidatus Margulisbacteria bacterium GWF2_38_17]OGI09343.1 MAG: SirA-like protein [Candidatus Margulisbacteria bacterium GWE2_39_32]PZM77443.1 MAG: SirA-like protein [Candidatus Margulisiibacteriota bacterium]HAR63994.1 SirA-like protein [Candidatus Margulisiibacteriota bacterium]
MVKKEMDCRGLKCPQPLLKVTIEATKMSPGDVLVVRADCHTFETDLRGWAQKMNKVIQEFRNEGTYKTAVIQF